MRALNRTFRGKDYLTDVLSFPLDGDTVEARHAWPTRHALPIRPVARYLGDVVIATGVASRQAEDARHSVATELRILALHGLLHLLGHDHETDDGQMARIEARLRRQAGLKEGLLERGQ